MHVGIEMKNSFQSNQSEIYDTSWSAINASAVHREISGAKKWLSSLTYDQLLKLSGPCDLNLTTKSEGNKQINK